MSKHFLYYLIICICCSPILGNPDSIQIWAAQENYNPVVEYTLDDHQIPLHPDLYQLGSYAAYKSGQFAEAIILAEKVLLSRPSNKQAKEIIKKSRQKQSIKQIQDVWGNRVQILMSKLNPSVLNLFAIFISLLAIAFMLLYFKSTKKVIWALVLAIIFWILTLISLLVSYQRNIGIKEGLYAIVMQNSFIHEGPDEESEKTIPLLSGTKVKKIDKSSDWFYVESEDGLKGWVPEADVSLIKLP